MKKIYLLTLLALFVQKSSFAQDDWMTNLEIAKRLALAQNKMLLMVWEESTHYALPTIVVDNEGNEILVGNLFNSAVVFDLLWDNFVLVKLEESKYPELYDKIKGNRTYMYLEKFKDDGLKVMDANGNILNTLDEIELVLDLSSFIQKYALNTSYIKQELLNYQNEKNFYAAFYLASKYVDYAFYINETVRPEIVGLSTIYLEEARERLEAENLDNKMALSQRCDLLEIEQELVLNKPRKVLRKLNRIEELDLQGANIQLYAFMQYVANKLVGEEENSSLWESKVSFVDLEKARFIIKNY